MKSFVSLLVWFVFTGPVSFGQSGLLEYQIIAGIKDTLRRFSEDHSLTFTPTHSFDKVGSSQDMSMTTKRSGWVPVRYDQNIEPAIYKDLDKGRYKERRPMVKTFLESDTLPIVHWQLKPDRKIIGGYVCLRAESVVRGRSYVVWYTPDIPVPNGPWKLHGLPGLILEGEDVGRHVIFVFKKLTLYKTNSTIELPTLTSDKELPYEEFKNHFKERYVQVQKLNYKPEPGVTSTFEYNAIDFVWRHIE
jgi:GLPGLI family protein